MNQPSETATDDVSERIVVVGPDDYIVPRHMFTQARAIIDEKRRAMLTESVALEHYWDGQFDAIGDFERTIRASLGLPPLGATDSDDAE